MQGSRASKSDNFTLRQIHTKFCSMSSGCRGHVFVDNFADTECRQVDINLQNLCNTILYGLIRTLQVKGEGKFLRVNPAKSDISISDSWLVSAAIVSRRSWFRAGTFGSHLDPIQFVDSSDAAATGANLNHFDNRDPDRQAAAFFKSINTINLEASRSERFTTVN